MARPPKAPAVVAEGLALVAGGMSPEEASEEMGRQGRPVGAKTLRRAGATSQGVQASGRVATPPTAPAKGKGAARKAAPRKAAPAAAARQAPAPIPPKADLLDELRDLLGQTKGMVSEAMRQGRGFASLGQLVDKLAARIHAIELARKDTGSDLAGVLAKGPVAVAKIRQGIAVVAKREVESGVCARCGAALQADVIVRRRAEAGMADAPPMH